MRHVIKLTAIALTMTFLAALSFAGMQDRSSKVQLVPDPENFILAPSTSEPSTPASGWGSIFVNDYGVYFKNNSGSVTSMNNPAETVSAANVITADEAGKTFFLSDSTEFASTLPAVADVSPGARFTFVVAAAPSGDDYTVVSGNSLENVITGGVVERETDTGDDGPYQADGDTITFADGVAVVGDRIDLVSDGSKYYLTGQVNADGAVTVTQAD